MEEIELEFIIKLDKEIYEKTDWNTRESFFNQLILKHLVSDYNLIVNLIRNEKESKQKKYETFLATLKSFKEDLPKLISYDLINIENNVEEIKIKCKFNYYENNISTLNKFVSLEMFDRNIDKSYLLSEDIKKFINPTNKEKVEFIMLMYKHIGDILTNAKPTLLINGLPIKIKKKKETKHE